MSDNLFVLALKQKLRFESSHGFLTTEQLFDVPLLSNNGFDLNSIAKAVNADLKESGEESFVGKTTAQHDFHVLRMDIVKFVIATKQAEAEANQNASKRAAERAQLIEILDKKQQLGLENLSKEEIQARLNELA